MLRQEVGYIAEVLLWESLYESMCIWVDGSLRNASFHEKLFAEIRKDFPNYRIAVLYVKSSERRNFILLLYFQQGIFVKVVYVSIFKKHLPNM